MPYDVPMSTTPPSETGWYLRDPLGLVFVFKNTAEAFFRYSGQSGYGQVGAADPDILWSDPIGPAGSSVSSTRSLTINGVALDLSADRSWSVGDVTTSGSYSNPSWISALAWSKISSTPTTLSGYGIVDAQPLDTDLTAIAALTGTSGFLKTNGSGTWTVDTATYLTGNQSVTLSGDAAGSGATAITVAVSKINGTSLSGLATGLLKNTTGTGVPSIAVNSDLPTMTSTVGGAVPTPPNTPQKFLDGQGAFNFPIDGENEIYAYQALGSSILAQTVGVQQLEAVTSLAMASQTQLFAAIYIPHDMSITGIMWRMNVQGNYTSNNVNSLALYSYSGGTLTKVAESSNNGNLWKAALNAFTKTPFAGGAYSATKGLYYIGALYCSSAQTTAPSLPRKATLFGTPQLTMDFTNSAKLFGSLAAQTTQTSPIAMSSIAVGSTSGAVWFSVYA